MGKTVVLATFGSLGDLHPYLALGLGLQQRGCRAIIATHECYRDNIESVGLESHSIRPDYDPANREMNARMMDKWRGTNRILNEGLFPYLRQTYDDLVSAVRRADILVSHTIVFPAPIIAAQTGISWISTVLAPISFASAYDPPSMPEPWMNHIWSLAPRANGFILRLGRPYLDRMCAPVYKLRRELGLPPGGNPLLEGQHSRQAVLALFSPIVGQPKPDWPVHVTQTGFPFYDQAVDFPPGLEEFLNAGEPPIVFTLGSAAVINPGAFFTESAAAVESLGLRAVFLVGRNSIPSNKRIFAAPYAPLSQVFPRASAIVHQGGIGTTAQGLRAGRPALIVPFAHDQPDNAARVRKLGAGVSLSLRRYSASAVAVQLSKLKACESAASAAARQLAREDGVAAACNAILGI